MKCISLWSPKHGVKVWFLYHKVVAGAMAARAMIVTFCYKLMVFYLLEEKKKAADLAMLCLLVIHNVPY